MCSGFASLRGEGASDREPDSNILLYKFNLGVSQPAAACAMRSVQGAAVLGSIYTCLLPSA